MELNFIWQDAAFAERNWIISLFSLVIGEQFVDGKHELVADNCLLIDSYLHGRDPGYYAQFRGKNAWLLHLSDETYEGGYDVYLNFRGVFRNYWSNSFLSGRVVQLPLGYSGGLHFADSYSEAGSRPYLWSFLGGGNKASRPEMLKALLPITPAFVHNTDIPGQNRLSKQEYQNILYDSVFVPCAMGNVNLESFRIYEALECGAVPIVERRPTLDLFGGLLPGHPLPTFGSWIEAARFVTEIRGDRDQLNDLQERCGTWWIGYKQRLRESIRSFVEKTYGNEAGPFVTKTQAIPGWQLFELLRHQSGRAFARRLRLQFQRLLREGKLRKTSGV